MLASVVHYRTWSGPETYYMLLHVNGASLSPVIVGRLHCGDNVVLAVDSKEL